MIINKIIVGNKEPTYIITNNKQEFDIIIKAFVQIFDADHVDICSYVSKDVYVKVFSYDTLEKAMAQTIDRNDKAKLLGFIQLFNEEK